jgi:hypothetical protein
LKRKYHNWNHIHKGLQELGFIQQPTYNTPHRDWLYYRKGKYKVLIEKSNKIDRLIVEKICKNIDISYDKFVETYERWYKQDLAHRRKLK